MSEQKDLSVDIPSEDEKRKADEKRKKKVKGWSEGVYCDLLFSSDGYATVGGGTYDPQLERNTEPTDRLHVLVCHVHYIPIVGQCQANEGRAWGKSNESAACKYTLPHSLSTPVSCSTSEAPEGFKEVFPSCMLMSGNNRLHHFDIFM